MELDSGRLAVAVVTSSRSCIKLSCAQDDCQSTATSEKVDDRHNEATIAPPALRQLLRDADNGTAFAPLFSYSVVYEAHADNWTKKFEDKTLMDSIQAVELECAMVV